MREAAAAAARALAFDGAARLYRRALELALPGDPATAALQEALGDALVGAGRGAQAAEALVAAARGAPADCAFELHRRAAEQLLAAGHVDEGLARLRACLDASGVYVPERVWTVTLGTVLLFAWLSLRGLDFRARRARTVPAATLRRLDACATAARVLNGVATPLGAYFALRTALLALAVGEPRRVFAALVLFSLYGAALRGRRAALVERARARAAEIAGRLRLAEGGGLLQLSRGVGACMRGDLRAMRAELTPVVPALRTLPTGHLWAMNVAHEFWFNGLVWSGSWRALVVELPAVIADARGRGNRWLARSLSLRFAHLPLLLADDAEGAARIHAAAREGWWPPRFGFWDSLSMMMRAEIHLYAERGRGPSAHLAVEALWPALARSGLLRIRGHAMYVHHGRGRAALAFAAGEGAGVRARDAALAVVAVAARDLAAIGNPMTLGFGKLAEAGLASARGDTGAAAAWARAGEALDAAGCEHLAAAARWRQGALTGGEAGARRVREAEAWLGEQGASDPARVAAMLAPG